MMKVTDNEWTCLKCRPTFRGRPGDPLPYGFETAMDKEGQRYIIGVICRDCAKKGGAA